MKSTASTIAPVLVLSLHLVVATVMVSARHHYQNHQISTALDEHWENYKSRFNREYASGETEFIRRVIWESNLQMIQQHNLEFDMGLHTYSLGMNEFGDLSHEEFKSLYLNRQAPVRKSSAAVPVTHFMGPLNMGALPDSVDWRPKGYVTPVKNQGQCGSCWAFSATGSLEGQYFRKTSNLVSLSEQQLVDCSQAFGNEGCNGGLMDSAFDYIQQNGVESEQDYPYTARTGTCRAKDPSKAVTTVSGHVEIAKFNESDLQLAVATVGPVSVAIDASHITFQFYRSGVYNAPLCSQTRLDHGVLAAGYGALNKVPYWLVKNSWGKAWGQEGYIFMSRNRNNQCGIATSASYPLL